PIYVDATKELQTEARREIVSLLHAALLIHRLRAECVIELSGRPGACMERARDELPERLEVLEDRAARIVIMRRPIVHVGGQPHRVANTIGFDERQEIGDLMLAPLRRSIAERYGVRADNTDRQIGSDHLPCRI